MNSPFKRMEHLFLVIAIALSLSVSAFAHRAGKSPETAQAYPAGIAIEAYRLPDGSLPNFCINSSSDQHADTVRCDFCTLAHGAAAPSPDAFPLQTSSGGACSDPFTPQTALHQAFLPGAPGTGPPCLS